MSEPKFHEALWTIKDVADFLGCSQSHVRRLWAKDRFPRPVRVGHLIRWTAGSVRAWLATQEGAPDEAPGPDTPFKLALRRAGAGVP
jgi:predicted DNA-binding transcriptional regulator AlpA